MNHIKGVITKQKFEKKYDQDGIPYKDYLLEVNNQKYTTQIRENIYLEDGMMVLLNIKPDTQNEVLAGYCIKEGYTWGKDAKNLKTEVSQSEKYNFLEGYIIEKQKSTSGSIYMDRSNGASKISYNIILENDNFHVSRDEGEYLQVGMNVAVVLDQKESIIILDKGTNKFLGLSKPYFIIFLFAIILFNGFVYYSKQTPFPDLKVTLIVINTFLLLATLLSIATFRATSLAKKYLLSKIS